MRNLLKQTRIPLTKKTDYAMVAKLKADAEQRTSQLRSLVEKMMTKQGTAIANADSMWSFLADGNFTVDEETQKQAQADIAEDGYWGVEQTSDRILDFAKALSGNDPEKADLLIDAFKKGFEDATKSWGKDLPDISQRTYDAVLEKFDKWKNGSTTETAGTENRKLICKFYHMKKMQESYFMVPAFLLTNFFRCGNSCIPDNNVTAACVI